MSMRRTSVRELIAADLRVGLGDRPRHKLLNLIETLSMPLTVVSLAVYRLPTTTLALLILLKGWSVAALYGLAAAVLVDVLATIVSWRLEALIRYRDLIVNYLDRCLRGRCTIRRYQIAKYLPREILALIAAGRVVSTRSKSNLMELCVIDPAANFEFAERKGFSIPIGGRTNVGVGPIPDSVMFVRDAPEDLTTSGWFQALHEIGHTTKHAWRRNALVVQSTVATLVLAWWLLALGVTVAAALSFSAAFFFCRVVLDYAYILAVHGSLENCEEAIADKFALLALPQGSKLNFLRRSIVGNIVRHERGWAGRRRAYMLNSWFKHLAAGRLVPLDNTWDTLPNVVVLYSSTLVLGLTWAVLPVAQVASVFGWHALVLVLAVATMLLAVVSHGCARMLASALKSLEQAAGTPGNALADRVPSTAARFGEALRSGIEPSLFHLFDMVAHHGIVPAVLALLARLALAAGAAYVGIMLPHWIFG